MHSKFRSILKELPGTRISFEQNESVVLKVYIDANYAWSIVNCERSLVTWKNEKEIVTSQFSVKVEFKAVVTQGI